MHPTSVLCWSSSWSRPWRPALLGHTSFRCTLKLYRENALEEHLINSFNNCLLPSFSLPGEPFPAAGYVPLNGLSTSGCWEADRVFPCICSPWLYSRACEWHLSVLSCSLCIPDSPTLLSSHQPLWTLPSLPRLLVALDSWTADSAA